MKVFLIIVTIFTAFARPSYAASKDTGSRKIGVYGLWRAYETTEKNEQVCYMTLTAHFPKNKKLPRGDALLTITHRPTENSKDVVSYTAGYNYKPMSAADMHIGGATYSLFTSQDTAWSRDAATDHKIAAAIQTAPSLSITGTTARKPPTTLTDKFALKGAAEAYRAISKACGIEIASAPKPAKPAHKTASKPATTAKKKPK